MKSRTLQICALVLLASVFTGCVANAPVSFNESKNTPYMIATSESSVNPEDIRISYISPDWPTYLTVSELTEKADNIYEGTIVGITYDVLDLKSSKSVFKTKDTSDCMLYTIYEISVGKAYKGQLDEKAYIKIIGGTASGDIIEQYNLLTKANIYAQEQGIYVIENFEHFDVGDSLLFLTKNGISDKQLILNSTQFAYDANATESIGDFSYNDIKSYLENTIDK